MTAAACCCNYLFAKKLALPKQIGLNDLIVLTILLSLGITTLNKSKHCAYHTLICYNSFFIDA